MMKASRDGRACKNSGQDRQVLLFHGVWRVGGLENVFKISGLFSKIAIQGQWVLVYPVVSSTSWQLPSPSGEYRQSFEKQLHLEGLQTGSEILATPSPLLLSFMLLNCFMSSFIKKP